MKLIIAIIQPHKLEDVLKELEGAEVHLKTVSNVLGCGRQKGRTEVYRGKKETGNLLKKVRLEIAVNQEFVQPTVNAIMKAARTGTLWAEAREVSKNFKVGSYLVEVKDDQGDLVAQFQGLAYRKKDKLPF